MAKYSEELKGVARALYLKRYTPQEIADELNLPNRRIVYYWAEKYCWAELLSHESTEDALNRRIQSLTHYVKGNRNWSCGSWTASCLTW